MDFADLGQNAFEDIEADPYTVAWQGRDYGVDYDAVRALGQVLLLKLELGPFKHRAVKYPPLAETHLRQRFGNRLGVEFAHAVEADRCNGGQIGRASCRERVCQYV